MNKASVHTARIDCRLSVEKKETLEMAASALGISVSALVISSSLEKAHQVLQDADTIYLDKEEHTSFIQALDNPPAPNKKLRELFSKHMDRDEREANNSAA